jgi:hypothetical protein
MQILWPAQTRDTIETIINTIGRDVIFYTSTASGCTASGCSLDPVTNTSTNSFCLVCSGIYWIPTWSGHVIKAHVTWKYSDEFQFNTGGQTFRGDGIIKIMYSGPYMNIVNSAKYVGVDGKQVNIEKVTLLGVPSINRIVLDFKERSKDDTTF